VSRVGEIVAPSRLGSGYRYLLASSWVSNVGDGIAIAAGPLLVASLTRNEFLVASAALLSWLPPLLFSLAAGVVSDRVDRRLVVVTVDLLRAAVLAVLAVTLVTGHGSIAVVLVAMFLLGTAEVFADNTTSTLLPMIVHRDDLGVANSRMQLGFVTINQFVGPPLGAFLFGMGHAVPFASQCVLVAFGALLVLRIALPKHHRETDNHVLADVVEGFGWVYRHAAVRTLVLTILVFNITWGAAWSVLVLYATRHLGIGSIGFGLLNTFSAVGGIVATTLYGRITRHVSLGNLMRGGLVVETLVHLGLALTSTPWVAMVVMFAFGVEAFAWGTTSVTVRQRSVPTALQGRVAAVNSMATYAGLVVGAAIGGVLAQRWGVLAPFWFAFGGSALFVVLMWRQLRHIAHADEPAASTIPS